MKVIVPIKHVAALDEDFELRDDGEGIDPDSVDWDLNEWDTFSLEAALQLREAEGGGEVVVVTVGDEETRDSVLTALAMGADRAIRVEAGEHAANDALAVARLLAAVVERERPDLVLCGVQSSDQANGATGAALSGLAGLNRVAVVRRIERDGDRLTVERELEGGVVETVRVPLPALLTVQTGINEPRYANIRGIKQAKDKPFEVLAPSDLGLDDDALEAAAGARVTRLEQPPKASGAELFEGDADEVAAQIANVIKSKIGAAA